MRRKPILSISALRQIGDSKISNFDQIDEILGCILKTFFFFYFALCFILIFHPKKLDNTYSHPYNLKLFLVIKNEIKQIFIIRYNKYLFYFILDNKKQLQMLYTSYGSIAWFCRMAPSTGHVHVLAQLASDHVLNISELHSNVFIFLKRILKAAIVLLNSTNYKNAWKSFLIFTNRLYI